MSILGRIKQSFPPYTWLILFFVSVFSISPIACSKDELYCDNRTPCKAGLVCIENRCEMKRCHSDSQCDYNEYCDKLTSRCQRRTGPSWTCRTDRDCRVGELCIGGICRLNTYEPVEVVTPDTPPVPEPDTYVDPNKCDPPCQQGFICHKGKCHEDKPDPPCKLDSDCKDGLKCNIALDLCQKPCQSDNDCGVLRKCKSQFCQKSLPSECDKDNPCKAPKVCNEGKCIEPECHDQKPCSAPKQCNQGKCVEPECHDQKPCPSPKQCKRNKCEDPPQTCGPQKACTGDKKCYKGVCVSPNYCESDSECTTTVRCIQNLCGYCQKKSDCYDFQQCENNKCIFKPKQPGEECKESSHCVKTALCLSEASGKKYCRTICDPKASPSKCPSGQTCALLSDGKTGACIASTKIGDPCTDPSQCGSQGTCTGDGNGKYFCRQKCDPAEANPGCPAGTACGLLGDQRSGACFPKKGAGALKPGDKCNPQAPGCEVNLMCIDNGNNNHLCMSLCNVKKQNCVTGAKCVSLGLPVIGACEVKGSSNGGEGSPCAKRSECKPGFYCLAIHGKGTCTPPCDPASPSCNGGKVCDLFVDYTSQAVIGAACGPYTPGNSQEGQACQYQGNVSTCDSTMFCFPSTASSGRCARPCSSITKQCSRGTCRPSIIKYNGSSLWGCI